MFNLKVTRKDGAIEQSEFATNQEAIEWIDHLVEIGYIDCTYEVTTIDPKIENISPRQLRLALLSLNLTESSIDNTINTLPSPLKEQAMIAWKYSTTFERSAEAVGMIGALLSLNNEQLDDIWKQAGVL